MLKNMGASALFFYLSFSSTAALGQNVFVLPGPTSSGSTVQVFSTQLVPVNSFTAGNSASQAFAKPDGSKYYIVANSGSQTVTTVDLSFSNAKSLGNLLSQATASALTPDGRRLLVIAGSLHVFDTTSDSDLTTAGILPGTPLTDVAISLDGTRAFVLGSVQSGGSAVYAVDLTNFAVVGNVSIPGSASSVSVGPNGLVYAATRNLLLEINPSSVAITPGGSIQLNAEPGRPAFTIDGKYLLLPNKTPATGGSVILIDLTAHTYSNPQQVNGGFPNIIFDRILPVSNTLAYGFSGQSNTLYQIAIPSLQIGATTFPGVPAVSVTAAAISSDVVSGTRTQTQNLYLISGNTLVKIDIPGNQVLTTVPVSVPQAQSLVLAGPAIANGATAALLQYGDKQALQQGQASLPITVRALDANGVPLFGIPVTFAVFSGAATIQNPTPTTGLTGFASTTVTASANSVITATAGAVTVNFNVSVGGSGGGPVGGGLSIVSGQGQIIFEFNNTAIAGQGSPFTVRVTDVAGAPVPNAPVTFTISSGLGGFTQGMGIVATSDGLGVVATTDAKGFAAVPFQTTAIQPGSGHTPVIIQAVAPGTNSVTFYVNTVHQNGFPSPRFPDPQTFRAAAGTIQKGALKIVVVDNLGQKLPNVNLRLIDPATWGGDPTTAPASTYVSCADPTGNGVLTDADGLGTCDVVFSGSVVSSAQFLLDVGNHFAGGPYNLQITPGAPASVTIVQGDKQTGTPGQILPRAFLVQVADAGGNLLVGAPVTFQVVTPNTLNLQNVSSATDTNGRASALGVLGNIAGTYQVKVSSGTASTSLSFTVNIPASGIAAVSGSNQTALINAAFASPLVVKVVDGSGAPVAGLAVSFAVTGGSATLGNATATTGANGQAQTTVTAGPNSGPITVTASSAGFSTSFTLASRLPGPTQVTFLNGASFQPGISPGAIALVRGIGIATGVPGLVRPFSLIGPLPTTLAGVTITFNGIAAPIYYVSNQGGQEEVAIQVPYELAPGTTTVVINAAGGGSATISDVQVQAVAPGVFETQYNGQNFAVATKQVDGSYVSPSNPAARGDVICVFANGVGQTTPATGTNRVGVANQNVLDPIDAGLNNSGVKLISASTLQGYVGVFQVCMQVPIDATAGPRQPVGLIVHDPAGDFFAQGTFVAIQ